MVSAQDSEGIVPGIEKLNKAGIPVIGADIIPVGGDLIATVKVDPAEGGRLIGQFLLDKLGANRKMLIIDDQYYIEVISTRLTAAQKLLQARGWKIHRLPLIPYGRSEAQNMTQTFLLANPDLAAVYTLNDDTALGAVRAVQQAGRRDILVCGYDAIPDAVLSVADGGLACTVFQDNEGIARWSLRKAVEYLKKPWSGTVKHLLPPVLVTKDNVQAFMKEHGIKR